MEITKEQFNEYKEVQEMGAYNMMSPQARDLTSLSKLEWVYIMKNYNHLSAVFDGISI
tara:strand:- start:1159 stop:1332 length:174 start_codon:yes stop_codon:yes gene_type:complete